MINSYNYLWGGVYLKSYRGRLDIIADILNAVSGKATKTQIMHRAKLNYRVLLRYLSEVSDASLVSLDGENRCYILTEKGQEFLDSYYEYSKTNRNLEKKLNEFQMTKKTLQKMCFNGE
jgi:predicted transcriptional regulator